MARMLGRMQICLRMDGHVQGPLPQPIHISTLFGGLFACFFILKIPSRNQEQLNCWEGLMDAERLEQRGLYEQIRFPEWQDRQEEEEEEEDSFDDPLPSLFLPLRLHLFLSSLEDSSELAKDLLLQVRSFTPHHFLSLFHF